MLLSYSAKKLTAIGILGVWFFLFGYMVAESLGGLTENQEAADHSIEQTVLLPALSPTSSVQASFAVLSSFLKFGFFVKVQSLPELTIYFPPRFSSVNSPPGFAFPEKRFKAFSVFRI